MKVESRSFEGHVRDRKGFSKNEAADARDRLIFACKTGKLLCMEENTSAESDMSCSPSVTLEEYGCIDRVVRPDS